MPLLEESALFDALLATLEAHGAAGPAGWQVLQTELAELCGMKGGRRQIYGYIKRAKAHGLVVVSANHVDSPVGWGRRKRAADTYHLKVTPAEWAEMRERVVAEVRADIRARTAVTCRNVQMERSRKVRLGERRAASGQVSKPTVAVPAAVPIDEEAVEVRVALMGDDEDLTGW